MVRPEDVDPIVAQILRAGSQHLLDELVAKCLPYLRYIRNRWGFRAIPEAETGALALDGVHDAVMKHVESGRGFLDCLPNAFRKLCRQWMRARRIALVDEICLIIDDQRAELKTRPQPQPDVADCAAVDEQVQLVVIEVGRQDRQCQMVIGHWSRGSSYKEIGQRLDLNPEQCKSIRNHNVAQIRERLRLRKPGLFAAD